MTISYLGGIRRPPGPRAGLTELCVGHSPPGPKAGLTKNLLVNRESKPFPEFREVVGVCLAVVVEIEHR